MVEEMAALHSTGSWDLDTLHAGKSPVGCRWVYTVKISPDCRVDRLKARLVSKGYTQIYVSDYYDTFSPVAKIASIRLLFSMVAVRSWPLYQLYIKGSLIQVVADLSLLQVLCMYVHTHYVEMNDLLRRRCFSVESKAFVIEEVGVGKKLKVVITERRWGRMSWISFGKEGAKILLKFVESLRAEVVKSNEGLVWCEKGRRYSTRLRKNVRGRFMICLVIDLDGKKHSLLFPEGDELVNGWNKLERALQELGYKEDRGARGKVGKTHPNGEENMQKERLVSDTIRKFLCQEERRKKTIWVDTGKYSPTADMGVLKYGVVGCWKVLPATKQTMP